LANNYKITKKTTFFLPHSLITDFSECLIKAFCTCNSYILNEKSANLVCKDLDIIVAV